MYRTGFGYDAHRLVEGRPLILGGVRIPHSRGLLGHSDADVLVHAVVDAVLGALGRGDIGQHFPDIDPAYKDLDSLLMLERVATFLKHDGYRVNNLDTTVVAERPKLAPFIPEMRENLARILEVGADRIGVKAKTSEGLGPCGRREGMEAFAVVTLARLPEEA